MKTIALRHLAEINPPSPEFDAIPADGEVLFLPLEAVWSDDRADQTRRVPKSTVDSGYTRFQQGDTVCPKVTPTFQAARSMRAASVGAGTTELHVLRPRTNADPRWITYAVRSKHFLEEGVTAFQGVAGLQRVPPEFVANFRVVDFPLEEQRRIADFLDDRVARIDQIVAARRRQILAVHERYTAWLAAFLDELGSASGWAPLRRFDVAIEQGWSPEAEAATAEHGEGGVLKLGAVRGGEFEPGQHKAFLPGTVPRPEFKVRVGDLLVTRANTPTLVGDAAVVNDLGGWHLYLSDLIYRLVISNYGVGLASTALRGPRSRQSIGVTARGTSGSMPKLRGEDILSIEVPLAPRQQHEALGAEDAVERERRDKCVADLVRAVALCAEYKQSLITAAVTGELDVTTAGRTLPQ